VLIETKVRKTRKREMKVSVFATCNEISKISKALRSRFIVHQLEDVRSILSDSKASPY